VGPTHQRHERSGSPLEVVVIFIHLPRKGTRAICQRMIRQRALIVVLLWLPLTAGAQSVQWKAIACTAENPEVVRGNAVTIYFTESGQVHFEGTQYPAAVNSAEIRFCFTNIIGRMGCYMISRISGRFTITMTGSGRINGSCTPEGQTPKF
jgi:hypothetical protein